MAHLIYWQILDHINILETTQKTFCLFFVLYLVLIWQNKLFEDKDIADHIFFLNGT